MEHRQHFANGGLGIVSGGLSWACQWISEHSEGLTHDASVFGIWVGSVVAALSFLNVCLELRKKWRRRNDDDNY